MILKAVFENLSGYNGKMWISKKILFAFWRMIYFNINHTSPIKSNMNLRNFFRTLRSTIVEFL